MRGAPGCRAHPHAAAAACHMNAMAFSTMVHDPLGRLPRAARPLPPGHLVAERAREHARRSCTISASCRRCCSPRRRVAAGPRATRCASASAPASTRATTLRSRTRFGFPLLEAWAMTETGAGAVRHRQPRAAPRRHGLLRPPPPDSSSTASSTRTAATSRTGSAGELLVRARRRGPALRFLPGYLKDDAATRRGLGGRLVPHRRRRACASAEGDCTSSTARKNVIRRSGENISAVEVESVLAAAPGGAQRPRSPRRPTSCAATRCSPASCREGAVGDAARARARARRSAAASGSPTTRRPATSPSAPRCR